MYTVCRSRLWHTPLRGNSYGPVSGRPSRNRTRKRGTGVPCCRTSPNRKGPSYRSKLALHCSRKRSHRRTTTERARKGSTGLRSLSRWSLSEGFSADYGTSWLPHGSRDQLERSRLTAVEASMLLTGTSPRNNLLAPADPFYRANAWCRGSPPIFEGIARRNA